METARRGGRGTWFVVLALAATACGSSGGGGSSPGDGGPGGEDASSGADAGPEAGAVDGGAMDGAAACVPSLPKLPWTSPYAGWSRGLPSDPSFFPIAAWLQLGSHAMELSKIGVNVLVGENGGTDTLSASDLSTLTSLGMYAIVGQDSADLANIDSPAIAGWWMTPDEPDNAQSNGMGGYGPPVDPATLVTQYAKYKAADPTRPIYLGLGQGVAYDNWEGRGSNPPAESGYVPASDIVAFDIYPYNNCGGDTNEQATCSQFWLNALGVDRLHQWSNRHQAVWTDLETTIISANTTTGPTPAQTASEAWLSILHGANGLCYFIDSWNPSFREDAIFADAAMVAGVTALDGQIKALAPVINSASIPNLVSVQSSVQVDLMAKASGTKLYVFAAIARAGTTTATFTVQGMTGSATAEVVGESRTVPVTQGKLTDAFAANGVHVYAIDLAAATCP